MPANKNNNGFTLIELLIAISIFGTVIGIAYSSYNASFTIIDEASKSTAIYAKARTTMERIMVDLESLYIGETAIFKGNSEEISGYRADNLQFTSTAYVRLHPGDASPGHLVVHYEVEEDENSGSLLLFRSQYSDQTEEDNIANSRLLLCDNLQEVAFDYQNKDGEELTDWDEEEMSEDKKDDKDNISLPSLISITLRFNDTATEEGSGTLFKSALTLPMAQQL